MRSCGLASGGCGADEVARIGRLREEDVRRLGSLCFIVLPPSLSVLLFSSLYTYAVRH